MSDNSEMNVASVRDLYVDIDLSGTTQFHGQAGKVVPSGAYELDKSLDTKNTRNRKRKHPFLTGILIGIIGVLIIEFIILKPFSDGIDFLSLLVKSKAIESLVDQNYLYDADKYLMQENMYLGMMYGLSEDNYSEYYTLDNYSQQVIKTEGSYVGIGVNVSQDPQGRGIYVASVTQEGPAFEAGILAGDIIIAADSVSLAGVSTQDAVELIRGDEGTFVDLGILRDEETLNISVERRRVITVSVHYSILTDEETGKRKVKKANIGYISINTFNMQTGNEFNEALDNLMGDGQSAGIIIDLRNNGGGELTTCLAMLDRILDDNIVPTRKSEDKEESDMTDTDASKETLLLQIESKNAIDHVYRSNDNRRVSLPIVVLVNENSASASEVFSGTLRDYGYKIIGTKTFGKGIVQTTYTLYDKTAIKFTTHQYRLAGGELIHGKGIEPDINVEFEPYNDYVTSDTVNYADGAMQPDLGKDNQIAAAVSELDEQIYAAYQLQ